MESFKLNERGKYRKFSLSHRLQQLEENFKASGGKFENYKLEDIFTASNGNFDIQQKHINGIGNYVISSGVQNLGIIGKTDVEAKIFPSNTITIDMFGNVYYRDFPYKMVTHARVFSLSFKNNRINSKAGLFISSCMQFLNQKFSYSDMASWEKIKKQKISIYLPTKNNQIDFNYMEKYIHVLETERVHVLETYLQASGLDTYTLTKEEQEAYDIIYNGKERVKLYAVQSLFSIRNTHSILQSLVRDNSGSYPYVTASDSNNAVSTYISYNKDYLEEGNSIMIGGKTLVITYQKEDYFSNDSHNLALYLKQDEMRTESKQLFLVSVLLKTLKPRYSWGDSISHKKIQDDYIMLPVNQNDEIDYELMETYIQAIKKKVIKNVVDWKDKEIEKTKNVVSCVS